MPADSFLVLSHSTRKKRNKDHCLREEHCTSLLVARCGSPWIRSEGCGRSQPVTVEHRNAGGESPPQMKPLNYHAINMQTNAKLGLNQISLWGLSGGGEPGRRGAHRGVLPRRGLADRETGIYETQAPQGHSEAPRVSRVWHGALLPIERSWGLCFQTAVFRRVPRPVS